MVNQILFAYLAFFLFLFSRLAKIKPIQSQQVVPVAIQNIMDQSLYWTFLPLQPQPFFFSQSFHNPFFDSNTIIPASSSQAQTVQDHPQDNPYERKKRRQSKRRNEGQLNKCFKCPYEQCFKEYASDLALNLHMKNKHQGGNKKDRDRVAKMILKSEMQGKPIPKCDIQLPPDYIKRNKIRLLLLETEDENEGQVKKEQ